MEGTGVRTIETELGTFDVRLTGMSGANFTGELEAHDPVVINRISYEAKGPFSYSDSRHKWVRSKATVDERYPRLENVEIVEPYVWLSGGWHGLRRVGGGDPTEGAREKFGVVLGKAIAPIVAEPTAKDEALAAERETAAEHFDREARYEREKAARLLARANKLADEAKRIRAGADYDKNKRIY